MESRINVLAKMMQDEALKHIGTRDEIGNFEAIIYIELTAGISALSMMYPYFKDIIEVIPDDKVKEVLKNWYNNQIFEINELKENVNKEEK